MKRNKMNKDIKTTKKPVKKTLDDKAIAKDISARGKKMYLSSRKTVSALKKLTKSVGKLITEANQTGNQKLANHITKLFGYLGFNTDSDANKVSWSYDAKVKPLKTPKVKNEKTLEKKDEQKPEKKTKRQKKVKAEKKPVVEATATESADAEPTDEEIAAVENDDESSNEVLAGDANDLANVEETGSVDDESDNDDEQESNEEDEDPECDDDDYDDDDREPESYEDGLAAYRREAWGNGDFERDDI